MKYIIAICLITFLTAGWVAVQLLARKFKTKNHIDNLKSGGCNCGKGACDNDQECENKNSEDI